MTNMITNFIISNIEPFKFAIIAILGVLLEGIVVEKGKKYAKIRTMGNEFQTKKKAAMYYFIEVLVIAILTYFVLGDFIVFYLKTHPYWTIFLAGVAFWVKFNLQIWNVHGVKDFFKF